MPDNTKGNMNIFRLTPNQPASMQMNRRYYLISIDKEFQFLVHLLIF